MRLASQTFPNPAHDHAACIDEALREAQRICVEKGRKLTPLRRRVLELIWRGHAPVTAYGLLDLLVREGHRARAPTVYRSLDFLLENGLVHRVESMNAYIGCNQPRNRHRTGFFICERCGDTAELADPSLERSIDRRAGRLGFTVRASVIEISGVCANCDHA